MWLWGKWRVDYLWIVATMWGHKQCVCEVTVLESPVWVRHCLLVLPTNHLLRLRVTNSGRGNSANSLVNNFRVDVYTTINSAGALSTQDG